VQKAIFVYHISLLYVHLLILFDQIGLKGNFKWHYITECMEIMKMLQSVSQVVSVRVQILENNINVNAMYQIHNASFDLLGIFVP
jgi:hypothetical protein